MSKVLELGNGITATLGTCGGCGAPVLWAKTTAGATVPLDPRAVVFRVERYTSGPGGDLTELLVHSTSKMELVERSFVTHFATCPKAREFSKGRK